MFCTSCGKQLPEGARFCPKCGASVGQAADGQSAGARPADASSPGQATRASRSASPSPANGGVRQIAKSDEARIAVIAANALLIVLAFTPLFHISIPLLGSSSFSMPDIFTLVARLSELASYAGASYTEGLEPVVVGLIVLFALWIVAIAFGIYGIVQAARKVKYMLTGPQLFVSFSVAALVVAFASAAAVSSATSSYVNSAIAATGTLWLMLIVSVVFLVFAGMRGWHKRR